MKTWKQLTVLFILLASVSLAMTKPTGAQSVDPQSVLVSAEQINAANALVREGKVDEAIEGYQEVVASESQRDELSYNLAVAQYRQGDLESATQLFTELAGSANSKLAARSRYNLGNCHYRTALPLAEQDPPAAIEHLQQAVSHFRGALRGNPGNSDARANIELAMKLIRELEKKQEEKQQEQKQDQDPQQGQNQNQENQDKDSQQQSQDEKNSDPSDSSQSEEGQEQQDQQQQDGQEEDQQADQSESKNQNQSGQPDDQADGDKQQQGQQGSNEQTDQPQSDDQAGTQKPTGDSKQDQSNPDQSQPDQSQPNQSQPNQLDSSKRANSQPSNSRRPPENPTNSDSSSARDQEAEGQSDTETKPVPTGELTTENQSDQPAAAGSANVANSDMKNALMTREEAMKMLQSVRDRDMLRRLQQQSRERTRHIPVDRDW